ncbi:polysaccharide biosynthesis protein [Chryseobacterium antibioticum]|uniref:Polysaccharide biosynthesis protein n=1 Tax=Chryseobacterium pyrolae TaxID=2987481 RepID=A0ABT2ILP7_9FLAO|nr:polysaccharide biosynthesis protein [Chryseobacterium pyrolae]MCT2409548.1 polysaccharide biosynthesis protein [Chryseobacterium pyrolae]
MFTQFKNSTSTYLTSFFKNGDNRSIKAKKNIFFLFITRLLSLPISFLILPLTIKYVDAESYGVWLTLSSIVGWMSFFDIGLNNGLRNKLAESLATGNITLARQYVSTTYAILGLISVGLFAVFFFGNLFINWSDLLKVSAGLSSELSKVAIISVGYFCARFVLSTIHIILLAYQSPAKASLQTLVEQAVSLIVIFLLTKYTTGSLTNLAYGLCIAPVLILLFFNLSSFYTKLKEIRPSLSSVNFSLTKDLMGVGFKFFIIQIAGIVQYQTANFIIIRSFGADDVTVYNIVFKYFSILTMLMAIFMTPLWSAVTDAYAKKDYQWIKDAEKKYRKIAVGLAIVGIVMLGVSNFVYDLWLGKTHIMIPFSISLCMFLFTMLSFFGSIYCIILNGISALDVQFKSSLFSPFLFIGLTMLFIKTFNWGVESVIVAATISNFNAIILAPAQYMKIFKNKS